MISYAVVLQSDIRNDVIGYCETLMEAKSIMECDIYNYSNKELKNYKTNNTRYVIFDFEEIYGRTFNNVRELNEFFSNKYLSHLSHYNTYYVFDFKRVVDNG